jgi:putative transposase
MWGRSPTCRVEIFVPFATLPCMSFYRRRLPHWQPEGVPIFLTWRLFGSLPKQLIALTEGQRFVLLDRHLDTATTGPMFLKDPAIAAAVEETFRTAGTKWELYELFSWVLMANHVHILLQPHKPLREVTRAVKNTSGRRANLILGRSGQPFWQDESYDHWVRNGKEFDRIVQYIEWNPVKAGLVEQPELWPWSSAAGRGPAPLCPPSKMIFPPVGQVPDLPK